MPGHNPNPATNPKIPSRNRGKHVVKRRVTEQQKRKKSHAELEALRQEWVKKGLVKKGVNALEALQMVLEQSTERYMLLVTQRHQFLDNGLEWAPSAQAQLFAEEKAVAYYSMLALQYDLAERTVRMSEMEMLVMGRLLSHVLMEHYGIDWSEAKKAPGYLNAALDSLSVHVAAGNGQEVMEPKRIMPPPDSRTR
jgi:hypothetical protein